MASDDLSELLSQQCSSDVCHLLGSSRVAARSAAVAV